MGGKLFVVAGCLFAAVAYEGWLSTTQPHYSEATPLTPRWKDMRLPVDAATVTFSDAETVSLQHDGAAPEAISLRYVESLTKSGWSKEADTSAGGIVNQTWTKDTASLAFTVMERAAVVSLSLLPF